MAGKLLRKPVKDAGYVGEEQAREHVIVVGFEGQNSLHRRIHCHGAHRTRKSRTPPRSCSSSRQLEKQVCQSTPCPLHLGHPPLPHPQSGHPGGHRFLKGSCISSQLLSFRPPSRNRRKSGPPPPIPSSSKLTLAPPNARLICKSARAGPSV